MIRLRTYVQGRRLQVLAVAVVVVLGLLIAWEHSGVPDHEMDGQMGVVGAICLAVVEAVFGLAVAAARGWSPRVAVLFSPPLRPQARGIRGDAAWPRPRAGPIQLQVFLR